MNKSLVRWVLIVAAASPAIGPALLIANYGVDFPYWDQWSPGISGMFIKAHDHQLTWADLNAQHNEHRILLPRLAYLALASLTNWNTKAEMWFSWLMACATSAGVLWVCWRTALPGPPGTHQQIAPAPANAAPLRGSVLLLWFLCNLCVFTLAQWENWLWGVGLISVMSPMWFIAMVVVLRSNLRPWLRTSLGIVCAAAATFTVSNGLLCWPLGAVLLIWSRSWKDLKLKKRALIGWMAGFVIMFALFLLGYQRPPPAPEVASASRASLAQVIGYLLAFSGSMLAGSSPLPVGQGAMSTGAILVVMLAVAAGYLIHAWRRRDRELCDRMFIWLVIACYTMISGGMAAVMRARYGAEQAASSRYVTFSFLLTVALVNLLPMICNDLSKRRIGSPIAQQLWIQIPAAAASLLFMLAIFEWMAVVTFCQTYYFDRRVMKAAMLLVEALPDNHFLRPVGFPDYPGMIERAERLSQIGYLHPPLISRNDARAIQDQENFAAAKSRKWGAFQGVDKELDRDRIIARGWAIFPQKKSPADSVFLTYENERRQQIIVAFGAIDQERPDMALELGDDRYLRCGWQIVCPITKLPVDLPQFSLSAWSLDTDSGKAFKLEGELPVQR